METTSVRLPVTYWKQRVNRLTDFHEIWWSNCSQNSSNRHVFHENVCSDIRIFYTGVREVLPIFSIFVDPRAYNLVQKPPPNTDGQF